MSSKKIKMTVSHVMSEYDFCENIIKVFITSQLTLFNSLKLSKLDKIDKTSVEDRISHSNNNGSED